MSVQAARVTRLPNLVQDGPRVLHEISFEVKSGERVGIGESHAITHHNVRSWKRPVGRTGSGKVVWSLRLNGDLN